MNKTKKMSKKNIPQDWRTPTEIERERKHDAICQSFNIYEVRNVHPEHIVPL